MTRVTARGSREFAFGVWDGVRRSIHDGLELTSKNEFPNSRFDQFKANGELEFWGEIYLPPRLRGKNVYVRRRGGRTTRQNIDGPISIRRHHVLVDEPLVNGGEPPGNHALDNVRRAPRPIAEAVGDPVRGYPADEDAQVGYVWIVGDPRLGRRRKLTNPSPPSDPFEIFEGQTYRVSLPRRVPVEAITGIGLLHKPPGRPYSDAFLQKIVNIRESVPDTVRLTTYLHGAGLRAPSDNETYVGREKRYPPLLDWFGRSPTGRDFTLNNALLAWQFWTEAGWSAMQDAKTLDYDRDRNNTALYCQPRRVPWTAEAWRMVVKLSDGQWYTAGRQTQGQADGALPLGMPAILYTGNPDKWQDFSELIGVEYQTEDLTGVPAPDEELEVPEVGGEARLDPGRHTVFVSDVYDVGESRLSEADKVQVGTGQNLRVRLRDPLNRRYGNVLPNADLTERDPSNERNPLFWTRLIKPELTAGDDGWRIRDSRGLASTQEYGESDPFPVNAGLPMTLRFHVAMIRRVGGSAGVRMRYLNASQNVVGTPDTVVASASGWLEATVGLAGNGYEQVWPAGTEFVQFEIVATPGGSPTIDLDANVFGLGLIVGEAAPRLRPVSEAIRGGNPQPETGAVALAEDFDLAYPETSYGLVVQDYAGPGVNAIEYFGAWDTILQDRLLPLDFEVPVEENRTYTLQVQVEGRGLAPATRLLKGVFVGEDGAILSETGGIALGPNAAGRANGLKSESWTAPPGAVSWRATANTVGRGRLVFYKPQFERGNAPTAWTSDYRSPGRVTQIFELWCPGAGITDKNGMLSVVKDLYDIVARADDPAATAVSVRVAFKQRLSDAWGAWFSDPAALSWLDVKRFVKVEVTLSTADPLVSPELYEYGVEVEREEAVLLRRDGSEFFGGVHVSDMPALGYPENEELRRSRYGGEELLETFRAREQVLEGMELTAYNRIGVEQVHAETAKGNRLFEIQFRRKRYVCRIVNIRFELQTKESPDGFGEWVAKSVDASVLEVKDLA